MGWQNFADSTTSDNIQNVQNSKAINKNLEKTCHIFKNETQVNLLRVSSTFETAFQHYVIVELSISLRFRRKNKYALLKHRVVACRFDAEEELTKKTDKRKLVNEMKDR